MASTVIWVHRQNVEEVNGQTGFVEVGVDLAESLIEKGVAQDPAIGGSELIYIEGEEPEGYVIPEKTDSGEKEGEKEPSEEDGKETTEEEDDLDAMLGVASGSQASSEEQAASAQ